MLNKKMNEALSTITTMSVEEKMLYISLMFEETIMDKDYIMGVDLNDEVPCVIICNSGVQRPKSFNPKYIIRDKAKAGCNRGSVWGGFGHWDKFGKPEKLAKDSNKDFQAQMVEEDYEEFSSDELANIIWAELIDQDFDPVAEVYGMVYLNFSGLDWRSQCQEVINFGIEQKELYKGLERVFYEGIDEHFPTSAMSDRKAAVEKVLENIYDRVDYAVHCGIKLIKHNRKMKLELEILELDNEFNF